MNKGYKDRTFDTAFGRVNKEWKQMAKLALAIRDGRGRNPSWVEEQQKRFTGIYSRLLTDPIEELKKEIN